MRRPLHLARTTRAAPTRGTAGRDALRALVEATAATGEAFFRALVLGLVDALGVKHAFVAVVEDPALARGRTLAAAFDGALAPNFVYELAGTPCERALAAGQTVFRNGGVGLLFPRDGANAPHRVDAYLGAPVHARDGATLGLIVVMDDRPIAAPDADAVVELFASRVAAELERTRAEEALRAERDFSRAVLDTSVTAAVVLSPAGRIVFASERAGRILGVPADRLVGRRVHPDELEARDADGRDVPTGELLARFVGSGEPFVGLTVGLVTPEGARRQVRVNGAPLRDASGTVTSVVLSLEDVTDRRALEEQLAHAQRMEGIGRLAGGVAHDFNNLLTVILTNARLAEDELPPESPLLELVGPIREAAQRGTALTRQLLAFARKQVVSPQVLDLNEVVRGVGRLLQRLLGERVTVGARLAPDLWSVRMDPGQLEQVLVNLAVNARDAMPGGGRVSIATSNETLGASEARAAGLVAGDYVHLAVSDTGHGMDAATLRRAFEPFFTTKGEQGTGLGLATCLGIVQQAGGSIRAESAPGSGAAFHVLLPRHADAAVEAAAPALPEPPRAEPATVLVVEDDESVRRAAVTSLRRAGYGVLSAASGPEAIRVTSEHGGPIDLLLSDVVLPGMNGREVAERLQALRPGLRVLFVSGYAEDEVLREAAADGSVPLLPKPYAPEDLVRWVSGIVGAATPDPAAR